MSNNNPKPKRIVPAKLKGAVFNSLHDLGTALGFSPAPAPDPRAMVCKKCGSVMQNKSGTNVWLCSGQTKDGKPCNNRAITAVRA